MPLSSLDETVAVKLKRAAESRCELCREFVPLHMLIIHAVPQILPEESPDPTKLSSFARSVIGTSAICLSYPKGRRN